MTLLPKGVGFYTTPTTTYKQNLIKWKLPHGNLQSKKTTATELKYLKLK